jgi:putative nucleotidyltransferase with HDIG domain
MIKSFLQRYFYIILLLLSSAIFSIFSFDIDGNIRNIKLAFLISFLSSFFILREFQDNEKIVFLLTFLIFSLVVYFFSKIQSRIDFEFFPQNSLLFAIPFFVLPSVLLYIIGEKKTIYTSSFVSLVSYFIHKDFSLSFIWFICSFVALISLKKARRRISLFKVGVFYGLCGTFLTFILENGFSKPFLFLFSSLFSPFVSVGLIYFIERTFRILTPFYLFDLQDFENPLLVQLRKRAPGTFHHSLFVADIASSVAEKLGVNAELVRCAALYHDVGKIIRPAYFIENLKGLEKHLKINPPLSSKVIIKHVEDGVKLARSYNIPERIIDFIREHHGTTYPEFFIKAAEEENPNFEVRYPGPSPRSIETVIVMIADSCEAALRSLEEITSDKIEEIVERVIAKKMEMRQFDNAPVTLAQLNKIKSATIETLIEFYHPRISYSEEKIKYYLKLKKEKHKQEEMEDKEENGTNLSHTNNKHSDGMDGKGENSWKSSKTKIKNSE